MSAVNHGMFMSMDAKFFKDLGASSKL